MIYTPLVVLFSTSYRTWNNDLLIKSQIDLINKISKIYKNKLNLPDYSNPIIGIHYWEEEFGYLPHLDGIERVSPMYPPDYIMKFHFMYERSKQLETSECNLIYNIQSTERALKMADILHNKLYNCSIPENQLILRIRPDLMIKYEDTTILENCDLNSHFYLSNTNTNDRPTVPYNSPEIGDVMAFKNKKSLNKLFSIPHSKYEFIYEESRKNKERIVSFSEQYLYNLLDYIGISVIQDTNILLKLLRKDHYRILS